MLGLLIFNAANSIGLTTNSPNNSDIYLAYFSLDRIKELVAGNKNIILKAFPEEAPIGWHCKAEDPLLFFENISPLKSYNLLHHKIVQDTYARHIFPLELLWLKNHRQLHNLILNTAIKAALEELKPTEHEVQKWVEEYIAFFFESTTSQPTENCPWSSYDVRRYSFLSDKCPEWLRPKLQKFSENAQGDYPPLYLRLEKTRKRLELYIKKEYASHLASQLLHHNNFIFLDELASNIAAACPSNPSTIEFYAQWLLNELGTFFKLPHMEGENYKHILIDKHLASQIKYNASNYFIKKHSIYYTTAKNKYFLNNHLLNKIIATWILSTSV